MPAGWIVHPFTDFSVAFPPDWIIDFWNDRPVHDKGALADGGAHAPSTTSSCRVTERAAGSSTMDDDIKGDQSYYALRPSLGCTSTYEKTTWQCLPELRVTTTCSGDPAYPPFHVSVIVYASAGEYAVSCDQGASDDWTVTPAITRTLDALAR